MALSVSALTDRDLAVVAELEALVRETYQLWDEVWVGFSWRNYTFDHVMRVRGLARTLTERENGDLRALEFAATLHDVTKSYDGEILMRDGKRVLDDDGFWLNEKLPPARQNHVTDLYDRLELVGTVHHVSGGHIASTLLAEYGYAEELREAVREIIAAHLKPRETTSVAGLALYDADTIDANIGLPAFYRNIQITMHRAEQEYTRRGESLDEFLAANLLTYLTGYLGERIPTWINGKRDDFIAKLTTESGKSVARDRIAYLNREVQAMVEELADPEPSFERGRLAVVQRFIANRNNPSLFAELADLHESWVPRAAPTPGALGFLDRYDQEVTGAR